VNVIASAVAGDIGFGIFVVATTVLIVFVTRFARSLGRGGRGGTKP
jgi:hypothetical protein